MKQVITFEQMLETTKFNRERLLRFLRDNEQPNDVEYQDYYFTRFPNGLIQIHSRITMEVVCVFDWAAEA